MLLATNCTAPPEHVVAGDAYRLSIVGLGLTVTVMVAVFEQPVTGTPSFAVTVYTVVTLGLAVIEGVVAPPGLQLKLTYEGSVGKALASSTTFPPSQKVVRPPGVIAKVGGAVTVTFTCLRGLSQPVTVLASLTKYEISPVTDTVYEAPVDKTVVLELVAYHFISPPVPVALSVTEPGPHLDTSEADGIAGAGFTVTLISGVDVTEQLLPSVAVTW